MNRFFQLTASILIGLFATGCSEAPPDDPATSSDTSAVFAAEAAVSEDVADNFEDVVASVTRRYFAMNPEMATYYGVPESLAGPGRDSQLGGLSPAAEAERRAIAAAIVAQLEAVDSAALDPREAIVHAVLLTQFRNASGPAQVVDYGAVFADYGNWFLPYPVSQLSGPQIAIPGILEKQQRVASSADAAAYLARLAGYGDAIDQVIAKIDADRKLGVVPPDFIIDKAVAVIEARSLAAPSGHSLVTSFRKRLDEAGVADRDAHVAKAATLIETGVYPANKRLVAALQDLRNDAGSEAGVWRLPNGEAFYRAMITHMTDTTMDPREIHEIGLAEVGRITTEMDTILRAEGYTDGTVGERMSALGEEERFVYPNTEEGKTQLIADLNAQMAEIEPLLPQWFGLLPKAKVVVKRVPVYAEQSATGGFYDAPAMDGSRPGTYWINLRDTAIWPSYSLKTLTYHEANPGHHLQTVIGMEQQSPILQTVLYSNAFGEGWGLYAEALAKEMGLYDDDPYGDLGRLQDELHRAIRLVVDTGMHALKWSRDDAIRYMVETEGAHPSEAESEIDRYVVWPGQALGYKIGMLRIQALRAEAEAAMGKRFDIRRFHDEVLRNDAVPLDVLEAKIERWMQ
jgi:uncharacterized protein (DUF885 family)